jgi:hypothetical protein
MRHIRKSLQETGLDWLYRLVVVGAKSKAFRNQIIALQENHHQKIIGAGSNRMTAAFKL